MRVTILAVGQIRNSPEETLCRTYLERLAGPGRTIGIRDVTVREIAESRAGSAAARTAEEARRLLAVVPGDAHVVLLHEAGRNMSSTELAATLRARAEGGVRDLVFVIGGPDGHGAELEDRADLVLSLGAMTWPHRLVRVLLAEQLYRAVTILTNHPYHRA